MTLARPPAHPETLVFLGTPRMAVPSLRALHEAGFRIELVVTGEDKRRGRGSERTPNPVKATALELGLPVSHDLGDALTVGADLGVVVAYGRLIPTDVLERLPMVNLHFSLLPRWRGAAPVERALLHGDELTGVCVMDVVEGLDQGDIHAQVEVPVPPDATADDLRRLLVEVGSRLLVDTLRTGLDHAVPQVGEPVYAHKLTTEDLRLDWARPTIELDRMVRLGGAHTTFRGKRLKVWSAVPDEVEQPLVPGRLDGVVVGTGDGALRLLVVQPEGRARIDAGAWRNGAQPMPDERLV